MIHRDIKPTNILVDDRERDVDSREPGPRIKLADFGLAREGTKCGGPAGTFAYMAPEAFTHGLNDSKLDIWSVGVLILQLLSEGKLPNPKTAHKQGPQVRTSPVLCTFVQANREPRNIVSDSRAPSESIFLTWRNITVVRGHNQPREP